MLSAKCPGQDRRNWKPEDIFEHPCPHCGGAIEFWKTDAKRVCPACFKPVLNPKFNLGCALWCVYADQCVGDISSVFTDRPEALRDRLEAEVRGYFSGNKKRLQVTLRAAELASSLLEVERGAEPPVVVCTALMHDIGYSECREELGDVDGEELQECIAEKSVKLAKQIMEGLKLPRPVREKVVQVISARPGEDSECEDDDASCRLWQDIRELLAFEFAPQKDLAVFSGAESKEELLERLKTESARKYARDNY